MHALIVLLALLFSPIQQQGVTIRECMALTGYTAETYEVLPTAGLQSYLEGPLVGYDLPALLDVSGVVVNELHDEVLSSTQSGPGYKPLNWARFIVRADGTGAQLPADVDPETIGVRQHYRTWDGENRRVLFIVTDLAQDGEMDIYAFVYAHPFEPEAFTPEPYGYGWHGSDCGLLRLR